MEKLEDTKPSNEEIDLGELFKLIGNLFNKAFKFLEKLLVKLFNTFIVIVLFFRNNALKLFTAFLIGGLIGFTMDKMSAPIYSSKLIIKPNHNAIFQLYSNIEYYNGLIQSQDTIELAKTFDISLQEATSLVFFEIQVGPGLENENLREFDAFVKNADSLTVSHITFKDFVEQRSLYYASNYEITVEAKKKHIFLKLEDGIVNNINNFSPYTREKYKEEISVINQKEININQTLESLDTLNNLYNNVLKSESYLSGKEPDLLTLLDLKSVNDYNSTTKELEVIELKNRYKASLIDLKRDLVDKSSFVNVISNFQACGVKKSNLLSKKSICLSIAFFLITLIVLVVIKINLYLKNYEMRIYSGT